MSIGEMRRPSDLVNELASVIRTFDYYVRSRPLLLAALGSPRWRLHVHPELTWIHAVLRKNSDLSRHVEVVADPACPDIDNAWVEPLCPIEGVQA